MGMVKKEKPIVDESMILSFIKTEKAKIQTLIIPLTNFEIFVYDESVDLVLPLAKDKLDEIKEGQVHKWGLSITDDPRIEWAGDWSDMGKFRMMHKGINATIVKTDSHITVSMKKNEYGKDMWMPDKSRWDIAASK